jgi:hypothetical protein
MRLEVLPGSSSLRVPSVDLALRVEVQVRVHAGKVRMLQSFASRNAALWLVDEHGLIMRRQSNAV